MVPCPKKGSPHHFHSPDGQPLGDEEEALARAPRPDRLRPRSVLDRLRPALPVCRFTRAYRCRILAEESQTLVLITHDVEEALHLADRVLVLSPRPTQVKATFDVPYPHPRKLSSPAAQTLKDQILVELGL